jgi:adenosine deaminase
MTSEAFIRGLPKTDLHMHLEGSLEPELMFELATRNDVALQWKSADEVRSAYEFANLQAFLDLYYAGCRVLQTERDFYDLTHAYVERAIRDGVIRAEVFMGPQSFTSIGVPIAPVLDGVLAALDEANRGQAISVGLIVTAQRHRTEADAFGLLEEITPWRDRILGIGMGGAEVGNPPSKFTRFFHACQQAGFHTTIHAGEEGPAAYIREAIEVLGVQRIDHGVACLQDPELVRTLAESRMPLTVCPLSNVKLKVVPDIESHPLRRLMGSGLQVTINSDDPAYFGGYAVENLVACERGLGLSREEIVELVRNGFTAAFLSEADRAAALARLDAYVAGSESDAASQGQ